MLSIQNLNVNYGESRVLHDVSMDVADGSVVCLMGRNGVGKTTLLKSIMGILKARGGHVTFGGADMTTRPPNVRAQSGIGYVPQGRGIFPYLTVYENLLMGLEAFGSKKRDMSGIDRVYGTFPVLKEMAGRTAGALSGGQQQQLAIGRALVRHPKLLVLDEPTEGVQPSIMHEIENVIASLRDDGGMAILLVEQFLDFALRVGDRYYVMETGRIVSQGSMAEFSDDVAREYLAV
ncbi:ABC transporter ATP-binding protein [Capsulimonas corticalis]|uniref:ABC transporter ATP-binding protein n=1 Tax=Capsulimonas corticalis TaxID=2219043 RepID=A0A402CS08_9BACT|nr:urea ABC transporter ATP-binding subunit UrtE [Capsulimonas corticalis]BDI28201.1 ABC transporter ATP-binding protein [Capsulimonas corticalis]